MAMRGRKMNLAFGLEVIYEDAEFVISDKDKVDIRCKRSRKDNAF